jgi:hypothetical protein
VDPAGLYSEKEYTVHKEYTAPDGAMQEKKHKTGHLPAALTRTPEEIERYKLGIGGIPQYDRKAFQELLLFAGDWPLAMDLIMYVRRGTAGRPLELIAYAAGSA